MTKEFKDYDLFKVTSVRDFDGKKFKSASSGVSLIIDHACKNQDPNKPFQPFVILEDDAAICEKIPDFIDIPDNCDLFYLGTSGYSLNSNTIHTIFKRPRVFSSISGVTTHITSANVFWRFNPNALNIHPSK